MFTYIKKEVHTNHLKVIIIILIKVHYLYMFISVSKTGCLTILQITFFFGFILKNISNITIFLSKQIISGKLFQSSSSLSFSTLPAFSSIHGHSAFTISLFFFVFQNVLIFILQSYIYLSIHLSKL